MHRIAAVAVATPAVQHYKFAKAALEAGKHVFVEKPLALTLGEAEELVSVAEHLDRRLMVGHLLQYHPAFLKLKELVREGRLGRLQYLYSNRLNFGKIRREEDILWSFRAARSIDDPFACRPRAGRCGMPSAAIISTSASPT